MPYNTTAIPPRKQGDPTGTTQLPISRVKKMISLDQEIQNCSAAATFVITLATEMFIQHLAEQGHNVVRSERKPRRNIQYRDLSSAISRSDSLEFLSDTVPKTVPFKTVKDKKPPATISTVPAAANPDTTSTSTSLLETNQTTLPISSSTPNGNSNSAAAAAMSISGGGLVNVDDAGEEDPSAQLKNESSRRGGMRLSNGSAAGKRVAILNGGEKEDVEMS